MKKKNMERLNTSTETLFGRFLDRPTFWWDGKTVREVISQQATDNAQQKLNELTTNTNLSPKAVIVKVAGRAKTWGYDKELDHIWLWVT